MKKGVSSQIFIYIFIVIVMAMVLLFGFKQIVNIQNLNEKAVYVEFKSDFKDAVNDVYYKNKGSVIVFSEDSRNKPLRLPNDVEQVCFTNNNVEILPYDDFNVDFLMTVGNFCIQDNNGLSFKLENVVVNQETFVEITEI